MSNRLEPIESELISSAGSIDAIEDLARRATATNLHLARDGSDAPALVRVLRDDERLELLDLEHLQPHPERPRGSVTITDPEHFAEYVVRLSSPHTTVWGDERSSRFVAVFNDHRDDDQPGWRDHTATLALQTDPDWQAWTMADGELRPQAAFAELLEDMAHTVVSPDAATMLEVAQTFQAARSASFESGTRLQSGDVQLHWHEETTAKAGKKGQLEVPTEFTLSLAPFVGSPPVSLVARLRYRISGGDLGIGVKLHRPDIAKRDAFANITAQLRAGLDDSENDIALLHGTPPKLGEVAR